MNKKYSRRNVLKNLAGSAAVLSTGMLIPAGLRAEITKEQLKEDLLSLKVKGNINHSVCKWCYPKIALEDLCKAAKEIGLSSIELL
jgi:hydroxypyruvate isomerase